MEDPPVEPEHQDQAESGEVPTDEKQEDVEPERCSGGEAHGDGDECGLGKEEEESSDSQEEEEEEVEPEQDDQNTIATVHPQGWRRRGSARQKVHHRKEVRSCQQVDVG